MTCRAKGKVSQRVRTVWEVEVEGAEVTMLRENDSGRTSGSEAEVEVLEIGIETTGVGQNECWFTSAGFR